MLRLNIISNTLKKEIKTKTLYHSINKLMAIIFAAVIIYSLSFFGAKLILQIHFNNLVNSNTSLNHGPENYVATVKDVNLKVENIKKIQDEAIYWSYLIEKISNITNDGILIDKLQASNERSSLYIKGQATTRDSLLRFKDNLENSKIFTNVELPIQSLLSKTNINFEMNLKIDSYEFK